MHENGSLNGQKVLQKIKFWRSFNQKHIYLLQKMQTILNIKTFNSRKQVFCQ